MSANKLAGKVALVTGASSGIGWATARALADAGARVAAVARRADRLASLVSDLGGDDRAIALEADVTDEAAIKSAVAAAHAKWGRLDVLVNNAGVMLLGQIENADTEDWRRMMDTNVLGLMYATHAALPIMRAQGSGDVVNISSTAGRTARAGVGAYNASKWAVNAFSEALRQECVPHRIRVTVIEPGIVATELREHITNPTAKADIEKRAQSLTQLEATDIAAAILYAVSQPPHVCVNEILIRPTEQLM
ncbi:MAG TPA: SDR family NAD(P)-dependent oxidoreductase [Gemmatimonadaceae bacterium]|nr:SDR family NAD(P)-dependent oxidoreductase [Gemmatimonadaceae bacterium]